MAQQLNFSMNKLIGEIPDRFSFMTRKETKSTTLMFVFKHNFNGIKGARVQESSYRTDDESMLQAFQRVYNAGIN